MLSVANTLEHDPKDQPIYKLHGSINWQDKTGSHILVIGDGKDSTIAKKEFASREKNPNSLMPTDVVQTLTEDELVDMVEYLLTLKAAPNVVK